MTDNTPQVTEPPYKPVCTELPDAPTVPCILPLPGICPETCACPMPPDGEPQTCLDDLIRKQNIIVKQAERAKTFAEELTAIQDKVKSGHAEYTQARFTDLRKTWKEQDVAIVELIRKLVCAVDCWKCLLECRLCKQLGDIRRMEDRLNGPPDADAKRTGPLTHEVHSLYDQQAWHERNVKQMEARLTRITKVLAAWEKPSVTLGEALEKNSNLIKESQNLIASDSAKVVYDVFMTLIPRHWAIRPRNLSKDSPWQSKIEPQYVGICVCSSTPPAQAQAQQGGEAQRSHQDNGKQSCKDKVDENKCQCDEGIADDCCGPDVGILSLRQRLIGPLPFIVDPANFPAMICCLTTHRLSPASEQLAAAQAQREASTNEIALVLKQIEEKREAIEANFREALPNPIDCCQYKKKPTTPPPPPPEPDCGCPSTGTQSEQPLS